jgi:Mlc titration factor MtfA (ptsG expression regulator)
VFRFLKEKRRRGLREKPFPEQWARWLNHNFPVYTRLSEEDQKELHGHIHVFLNEKRFEGCEDLEMTEEIRVTVAAQACLLLLHRETDYFPSLHSILIYPEAYVAEAEEVDPSGVVTEFDDDRTGETWEQGSLVLSWDDTLEGGRDLEDSYNVVLHEFTHQLDLENGEIDGVPRLDSKERYASWTRAFTDALKRFQKDVDRGRPTLLAPYGADDPGEFFAVAVEGFFEMPAEFKKIYPDVYNELSAYFRQDPAAWASANN